METFITRTEKIPFYQHYDIIVAGGGVAGAAAALAAAREGKQVLLIEKTCILGGLATIGHVNFFVPMCNGRGKQIIPAWQRNSYNFLSGTVMIPSPKNGKTANPPNRPMSVMLPGFRRGSSPLP